jgi:biotin synthase
VLRRRSLGALSRLDGAVRSSISLTGPNTIAPPLPPPPEPYVAQSEYAVRNDWTREEVGEIYRLPFPELLFRAASAHRAHHNPLEVQRCTLLSVKTGGCTEDCKYCAQSSRYTTSVKSTPLMPVMDVIEAAKRAKAAGSTRFCMGTAWRELGGKKAMFRRILQMVREVREMDMEVCCTLGMVSEEQAVQLKEAGLSAYNHNLDTSREHYGNVITTRSYDDRLQTIANVRKAGISVCCGGILGLGESEDDRIGLLTELATMEEHPESVPINALVSVEGTPFEEHKPPDIFQMARTIATARVVMPKSMVRLSAGRLAFSELEQSVMFLAGANSIFAGEKLLTTPNPAWNEDAALFDKLGLVTRPAFRNADHAVPPKPAPVEAPRVRRSERRSGFASSGA